MRTGGRGAGAGFDDGGGAQDPPRLVEGGGDVPPAQAWAVGLLRRTPSYRPPLGRKQRVRLGLAQAQVRRAPALVLRPAMTVLVLVGLGAVASAALGRWPALVADAYHRLVGPSAAADPAPETTRVIPSRPSLAGIPGVPAAESAPAPLPDDSVPAAGSAGPNVAPPVVVQIVAPPARGARRAAAAESARNTAPVRARGADASARAHHAAVAEFVDETAPVIEAMRALRVQGDPVRARALLTRYLVRHPSGTLAEEALAMSIEAANVHRDGDAAALARRYLRLYPAGHFAALARQTLDAGSAPAGN